MAVRRYAFTTRRRSALRKAQLVSARKRRGRRISSKTKRIVRNSAIVGAAVAFTGVSAYSGKKAGRKRQQKRIDKIVESRWGVNGSEINGVRVQTLSKISTPSNEVTGHDGRKKPPPPYVPGEMLPGTIDLKDVNKNRTRRYVRQSDGKPYRDAHTMEQIRRRKRNRWAYGTGYSGDKTIPENEVYYRINAYERYMNSKGIKINYAHRAAVLRMYREQKY
jgi:hypothetical protein